MTEQTERNLQCATFYVEKLFLGIEVQNVQEVLRIQETTRVPRAPAVVQGLINLRGQIVTAIDMRRRLGLPVRSSAEMPMNMVVRTEGGAVSLLVDEIGEVIEVRGDQFEPPPGSLSFDQLATLRGVYKLDDELMLLLDPEKLASIQPQSASPRGGETLADLHS